MCVERPLKSTEVSQKQAFTENLQARMEGDFGRIAGITAISRAAC